MKINKIDNRKKGVVLKEKYSNALIKRIKHDIARPSIPSIKLIAFTIATIIIIVRIWETNRPNSKIPMKPCRLSIIKPLSIIIFAAMIWNINFNLKSSWYMSSYKPTINKRDNGTNSEKSYILIPNR